MIIQYDSLITIRVFERVYTTLQKIYVLIFHRFYSKISIIRTMIIRISGLIQTLMNVPFLMYGVHMWLVD